MRGERATGHGSWGPRVPRVPRFLGSSAPRFLGFLGSSVPRIPRCFSACDGCRRRSAIASHVPGGLRCAAIPGYWLRPLPGSCRWGSFTGGRPSVDTPATGWDASGVRRIHSPRNRGTQEPRNPRNPGTRGTEEPKNPRNRGTQEPRNPRNRGTRYRVRRPRPLGLFRVQPMSISMNAVRSRSCWSVAVMFGSMSRFGEAVTSK
jgi:hypothetical protein